MKRLAWGETIIREERLYRTDPSSLVERPFETGLRLASVAIISIVVHGFARVVGYALHLGTYDGRWVDAALVLVVVSCFGYSYLGAWRGRRVAGNAFILFAFAALVAMILILVHSTG